MYRIILSALFLVPSISNAQTPASMLGKEPQYMDRDQEYVAPKNEDVFSAITEDEEALFTDNTSIDNLDGSENQNVKEEVKAIKNSGIQNNDIQKTVEDSGKMVVLELDSNPWLQENEPQKTENNLLRIKYSKLDYNLQDADITAISSMLNLVEDEKLEKIIIKSYSSRDENNKVEKQNSLIRVLKIRNVLEEQGYDLSNVKYKVFDSSKNKFDLDYIDIDKI